MSKMSRMQDDYLDPDRHLWPEGEDERAPIKCNRCRRELEQGNWPEKARGFCSSICDAFAIRDLLVNLNLFSKERGLHANAHITLTNLSKEQT